MKKLFDPQKKGLLKRLRDVPLRELAHVAGLGVGAARFFEEQLRGNQANAKPY